MIKPLPQVISYSEREEDASTDKNIVDNSENIIEAVENKIDKKFKTLDSFLIKLNNSVFNKIDISSKKLFTDTKSYLDTKFSVNKSSDGFKGIEEFLVKISNKIDKLSSIKPTAENQSDVFDLGKSMPDQLYRLNDNIEKLNVNLKSSFLGEGKDKEGGFLGAIGNLFTTALGALFTAGGAMVTLLGPVGVALGTMAAGLVITTFLNSKTGQEFAEATGLDKMARTIENLWEQFGAKVLKKDPKITTEVAIINKVALAGGSALDEIVTKLFNGRLPLLERLLRGLGYGAQFTVQGVANFLAQSANSAPPFDENSDYRGWGDKLTPENEMRSSNYRRWPEDILGFRTITDIGKFVGGSLLTPFVPIFNGINEVGSGLSGQNQINTTPSIMKMVNHRITVLQKKNRNVKEDEELQHLLKTQKDGSLVPPSTPKSKKLTPNPNAKAVPQVNVSQQNDPQNKTTLIHNTNNSTMYRQTITTYPEDDQYWRLNHRNYSSYA